MVDVWNWQLNRKMEYKYDETRPSKQVSAVFDINKCIACQTCTMACKTTWTSGKGEEYMFWNSVETKPWGSYPMGWDVRILDKLGSQPWDTNTDPVTFSGKTIFEKVPEGEEVEGWRPDDMDWAYPNRGEDETNEIIDKSKYHLTLPHAIWNFYLARICMHCTYPACVAACPRKAIYKRKEDGIVLIDQKRCRGYRECVRACPYKRSMYNHVTRISEKCIFCYPAVEEGIWPRCMRNCVGKIRLVGYVNKPEDSDPKNPIDFLVHEKKVALPLYPQLGTEPNIYYIPPIHSDAKFLKQMFGPGVDNAVKIYKNMRNGNEPELRGVLLLCTSTDKILGKFAIRSDEAIGYDTDGNEVARLPLVESQIRRVFHDSEREVYRHNIT
ncbi:MAG: 4Fe-4S dicluster domain-containing protein [Candidatus Thermoplasmatota archaeon]|nr:4Fe-4S dicluster domain-containing protein [Candidatus Thermoplasmatota archaeon]MDP7266350.1 4Fe-4S dicluster domain-containing protein [Candidatus Thermoplasmatota archaeon]